MTMRSSFLLSLPLCASLAACAGGEVQEPKMPQLELEPTAAERLAPMTIVAYTTTELMAELERARGHMMVERYGAAARGFDRVSKMAGDPQLIGVATYEAGRAYEAMGKREEALERYQAITDEHPTHQLAKNALIKQTRLLGYLERWPQLVAAADELLGRGELPVMDRIEALGAKALGYVEQEQIDKAKVAISKAQALIEQHQFGRSGPPPVQLAQVSFAEGEVRRLMSETIALTPVTEFFPKVLEARCQGLLDAQSAYTEAMRSRDAHWSAMSGYRVGQLYQQLHVEAMQIPPPEHASLEQQQLFEAAMRLRYRILLEKGLKMMEGTVRLGERTGEDSYWVTRAKEAKRMLEQALADEQAALDNTPYSEAEIQAALDKLKGQAKNNEATSP
jgi:tetratricopeptide (TPR) repeat protein